MSQPLGSTAVATGRALHTSPVSPAKLAHLALRTSRLEAMTAFYGKLLNADAPFVSPMMSLLRYDDEHHRLALIAMPPEAGAKSAPASLAHFAFTFVSLGDLLSNYVRLRDMGIVPAWSINHGATISFYYADPDGNMAELQVDTMSMADADALITGEYFAVNPVGVDIDPEVLLDRYLRGDSIDDLFSYGSAPYADETLRPTLPGMFEYDWRGERLPKPAAHLADL